MTTAATLIDDCEMCAEVQLAGAAVTGQHSGWNPTDWFSRLIHRTPMADVMSGLGCLEPGYTLVVPHRHVTSIGELEPSRVHHVYRLAESMAERIRREFGRDVVIVEHGSSGVDEDRSSRPACISHAHVHLFPVPRGMNLADFIAPKSASVTGFAELIHAATGHRNYYYCAGSGRPGHLATPVGMASQHARRVWARVVGKPNEWDWAAFPYTDNCRQTAVRLRADDASRQQGGDVVDDGQAETVATYSAAATWYAARTRTFPPGSTLQQEMAAFDRQSEGQILDAGAGACRDAAYLGSLGRSVIALDASGPLLKAGLTHPLVRKLVGDIRRLPMRSESLGAIWCSAVLLHLDEAGALAALREFQRVLRAGGLVHVTVKQGKGREAQSIEGHPDRRRHFFYYDTATIQELATWAGFDVVETWTEDGADVSETEQTWEKALLRKPR